MTAPSETRANLCFTPPAGETDRWHPDFAALDTGDLQNHEGIAPTTDVTAVGNEVCVRYSFYDPLDDQHGPWTLSVPNLERRDPAQPDSSTWLSGPWVFHFHVP